MTRSMYRHLTLLAVLACSMRASAADPTPAEVLFDKGLKYMQAGRYGAGCPIIAESYRVDPRPGTLFTLATCEERWGHVMTAVARYDEYLKLYEKLPEEKRAIQGERPVIAKAQREKLVLEIPVLAISLPPGAPSGLVVKRDGIDLPPTAIGVAFPVDPGEHRVTTQAPGGAVLEHLVSVVKGEKKSVVLDLTPRAAPLPPPAPKDEPPIEELSTGYTPPPAEPPHPTSDKGLRILAYVIGGLGAASLAVGGGLGIFALTRDAVLREHCSKTICDQQGFNAVSDIRKIGRPTTILLAVGAAIVWAPLVLVASEPKSSGAVKGAAQRRRLAAGVSLGPTGMSAGVQGAW